MAPSRRPTPFNMFAFALAYLLVTAGAIAVVYALTR